MTKPIVRNPKYTGRKRPVPRSKPARNIAITRTMAAKRRGELSPGAVPSHESPGRKTYDLAWQVRNPNYAKLYRARLRAGMPSPSDSPFINQCRREFRKERLRGQDFVAFVQMKLLARLGLPD